MKKLTLQWRITLLTALVLAISSIALTAAAIANANSSFMILLNENSYVSSDDVFPAENTSDAVGVSGEIATPAKLAKRSFDARSILFCAVFTAVGSVIAYYMAGRALSPLRRLSGAVGAIDENSLSRRLPKVQSRDEVGVLTERFNEMLSRLDEAFLRQKRFTANAAHELKTPLAAMKTGIQVLSADKRVTLADYEDYAQKSLSSINRLSAIVDDLLLLASAGEEGGREKEEIWLEPLFEAILNELSPKLEEREIICTVDCGEASVCANASFLYRSFFNLVENACKYGKQGGHIRISAEQTGQMLSVSVEDDGPGIRKEHIPYIFDAFYRADKSRSREMGGSGLGLSLVKTMIEAEGGQINVKNRRDGGTCFTVTFSA